MGHGVLAARENPVFYSHVVASTAQWSVSLVIAGKLGYYHHSMCFRAWTFGRREGGKQLKIDAVKEDGSGGGGRGCADRPPASALIEHRAQSDPGRCWHYASLARSLSTLSGCSVGSGGRVDLLYDVTDTCYPASGRDSSIWLGDKRTASKRSISMSYNAPRNCFFAIIR